MNKFEMMGQAPKEIKPGRKTTLELSEKKEMEEKEIKEILEVRETKQKTELKPEKLLIQRTDLNRQKDGVKRIIMRL